MNSGTLLRGILAAAALGALAGCGAAAGGTVSVPAAPGAARAEAPGVPAQSIPNAALPTSGAGSGGGSASTGSTSADSSSAGDVTVGTSGADIARSVVAAYTVPAGSFLSSFDTVMADGAALGGYVVSSKTSPDRAGHIVSGSLTLAVPAAQMASLLNSLPSDFTPSFINFASVDESSSIVDTQARLTSAQAHLTALQGLLRKATSLSDIVTLEQQIGDVETDIDTDQGQLSALNQSVADATVTIELKERGAVTVAATTGPSVTGGISKGWTNLVAVSSVALEVLVTALPGLVIVLAGCLLWWRHRRRGSLQAARGNV